LRSCANSTLNLVGGNAARGATTIPRWERFWPYIVVAGLAPAMLKVKRIPEQGYSTIIVPIIFGW